MCDFLGDETIEGERKCWHKNGQLKMHAFFADGLLRGTVKVWDVNGRIQELTTYLNNGYISDRRTWHADGSLVWDIYLFNYRDSMAIFKFKKRFGMIYAKYKLRLKTFVKVRSRFTESLISDLVLEIIK
jgi:antitoxin component YwqK of YwqJK toxin-antitoxin module